MRLFIEKGVKKHVKRRLIITKKRIFYISYNTANFVITDIMVFNKTGITV